MENITFIISVVVLLALLLAGCKVAPAKEYYEDSFSLPVSKGLQGFFALGIIFHHCSVWLKNMECFHNLFSHYFYFPVLLVGFFFFCSGYGLFVSFRTKPDYLKGFIPKRVLTVLVPFFICNYIYMITTQLYGRQYPIWQLILAFFGLLLINNQMWFAIEIMILYLIFYFIFRYIKKEKTALAAMGICTVLMIIISLLLGHSYMNYSIEMWFHGEWWYSTTLFFFLGMLYAYNEQRMKVFMKKFYYPLLIVSVGMLCILLYFNHMAISMGIYWTETMENMMLLDKLKGLSIQIPMVFFFMFIVLLVMMKIRFHNQALAFLGKISLEIILINYLFIMIFEHVRITYGLAIYLLLVVICTIVAAILLNKIKQIILERDNKGTHII